MRLLLTNDDGIDSKGLASLFKELSKFADVTVVAPSHERSSISHAITLNAPLSYRKVKWQFHKQAFSVDGTPADCVKLALGVIMSKKPDMVISGINIGDNDGHSVHYSGTVAAAREGAISGIPSVALSLASFVNPVFTDAARYSAKLVKRIFFYKNDIPDGVFLNVNIPNKPANGIKGVRYTRQGTIPIHTRFTKKKDAAFGDVFWMSGKKPRHRADLSVDTYALKSGYITVTPVKCDVTDDGMLAWLAELRL